MIYASLNGHQSNVIYVKDIKLMASRLQAEQTKNF